MSARDPELDGFLDVLGSLLQRDAGGPPPATGGSDAVQVSLLEAGALDLAVDAADLDDGLRWLVEVVARTARHDPSLAYVLATRYVAQRAVARLEGDADSRTAVTAALAADTPYGTDDDDTDGTDGPVRVTVAHRFAPERVVVLAADHVGVADLPAQDGEDVRRVGLPGALLDDRTVTVTPALDAAAARDTRRDWSLLVGAACLGTAQGALDVSTAYAGERRQFGTRLVDFAGLRAVIGEMALEVTQARGLLETALSDPADIAAVHALVASVGRAGVEVGVDAIQVHGGYGYIDEYPVAGFLRDAISLRARCLPRRGAVAALVDTGAAEL